MAWREEMQAVSAAAVGDALDGMTVLPARLKPIYVGSSTFCGPAYTVTVPAGDNLGLHYAVGRAVSGSVIVATCLSDQEFGMWGEVLSRAARARKIRAVVIDSYVRDTEALAEVGVPVYARGVSLRKSQKHDPGRHSVALHLGRVALQPGDLVVGDHDGLVVVPAGQEVATFARAREISSREAAMLVAIDEGVTTVQLLGLPPDPSS